MKLSLFLLLSLAAVGQTIDAGGPSEAPLYTASAVWNTSSAGYISTGDGAWADCRYAPSFSYAIPEPNGLYIVSVGMLEPRLTAANQRIFTVAANGSASAPLDLFALAGVRTQYTLKLYAVVNTGVLKLDFRASVGNALVCVIDVAPYTLTFDRAGYPGPLVPFIMSDGSVQPAMLLNGAVAMELPSRVQEQGGVRSILSFGFPALQFGVILTQRADGKWAFPSVRPNPANSVAVTLNGLRLPASAYGFSWSDPNQLPDALAIPTANAGDLVVVDYVAGGVPAQ